MGGYKSVKQTESAVEALEDAVGEVESLRDEMGEWRDNLEEKLSATQKYEDVSAAADALDGVSSELEGLTDAESKELIGDAKVEFTAQVKKSGAARWARCSNAVARLEAVLAVIEERIEHFRHEEDEDKVSILEDAQSSLESVVDGLQGIDFPGMY